jgi:hypothetical protein
LLAQGRLSEARAAGERAIALSGNSHDLLIRLTVNIAGSLMRAVTEPADTAARSERTLETLAAEAAKAGIVSIELEALLARGEAEMRTKRVISGRARLAGIEKAAKARGFHLIARKAARLQRRVP